MRLCVDKQASAFAMKSFAEAPPIGCIYETSTGRSGWEDSAADLQVAPPVCTIPSLERKPFFFFGLPLPPISLSLIQVKIFFEKQIGRGNVAPVPCQRIL